MHRQAVLSRGQIAHCVRCEAVIGRYHRVDLYQVLALTIAAAILFVIASLTPVLAIEFGGAETQANVWTAALSMDRGWIVWAALVLVATTFLVPMLQIVLLLWLLAFASVYRRAPGFAIVLVALHRLRPWSMSEVFLLGALIAMIKLSNWVPVAPGPGMWALVGLTIVLAILGKYEPRSWWTLAEPQRS